MAMVSITRPLHENEGVFKRGLERAIFPKNAQKTLSY